MKAKATPSELIQLAFLLLSVAFIFVVFFFTPALRPASLLTVLNLLFMGPAVNFLNRKGLPKTGSILLIFSIFGVVIVFGLTHLIQALVSQWSSFVDAFPVLGESALQKLGQLQQKIQNSLNIEINLGVTHWLIDLGKNTQDWALNHAPTFIGNLFTASLLAPLFTFFILKDSKALGEQVQKLIPKNYSKQSMDMLQRISASLGQFLRAKLLEALLVGLLIYLGLILVDAPYPGVFALIAGVTNVIPYLGPILGAAPALITIGFSDLYVSNLWPAFFVFLIVNAVDMLLIFPVFVAKLVNLSPLTLLASVAVGQELYGLIGMLLAVPLASICKIIFQEIVEMIYE